MQTVDMMVRPDQIELTLLPASDDPQRICYEVQAKLLSIRESLRKHGVGVITIGAHPSGDTHMGQFILTLGPGAIPAVRAIAGAWMETRSGRGVRVALDEVEVEASAAEALDDWLKWASRDDRITTSGQPTEQDLALAHGDHFPSCTS